MHARITWSPLSPSTLPTPQTPADIHACEASWGCESALPFLWRDTDALQDDDQAGASPWPSAAPN